MPLVKEPIWLFHTIERYLSDLPSDMNKFEIEEDRLIFQELRSACDFPREFEELKNLLSTVSSPVCFTHNDFQPGNILRLKSRPENFTVIDF
jgi:thiamine kinase-like enzyme